jgi:hypothetical protein
MLRVNYKRLIPISFFFCLLFLFENCAVTTNGNGAWLYAQASPTNYFSITEQVDVDVYYEPGAEPYTGNMASGASYWSIVESNLDAIFQYRSIVVGTDVPTALAQMSVLPAQSKSVWTTDDIIDLHRRYHGQIPTATTARFYVYFVRGYFYGYGATQPNVLGVSVNGTPVVAIFKDVIAGSGISPGSVIARYVEQSTLVHELGHALGFVNNGVPMASPHQDSAHGAHTTDSDCVMYWQNEGVNDMALFVQRYLTSASVVMWGPKVLSDAQNYSR